MKYLMMVVMLMFCVPSHASDYYFGGGIGLSKTNYDVTDDLKDNEFYPIMPLLKSYGHPIDISSDMNATASRIFIGKHLSPKFDGELSYDRFGEYSANMALSSGEREYGDHTASLSGTVAARIKSRALSASLIGYLDIVPEKLSIFSRVGVSYFKGDISGITRVDGRFDEHRASYVSTKHSTVRGVVPHIGLGINYKVNKQIALRVEGIRYGDVYDGTNIETITASVVINIL